jgi:hypothetical protein
MANRKISDLTALTAPATGDLLPIVDISEAAAADKNKKITIGELFASIPLGSAAAPSVAFEGDSNTGIYSPGADQLSISTGGTGRVFVDASGNVGVGTVTPSAYSCQFVNYGSSVDAAGSACFVNDASTADTSAQRKGLLAQGGGTGAGVSVWQNSFIVEGQATGGLSLGAYNASGSIKFYTNTTRSERMRITSAGLVGIGTSSPSGKLNILQDSSSNTTPAIRITGSAGDPTNYYLDIVPILSGSTVDYRVDLKSISTNTALLYLSGAGRVGIGTTSPQRTLSVQGIIGAYNTTGANDSHVGMYHDGSAGTILSTYNSTGSFSPLVFLTSNLERFRVDTSGRLLVGTSTSRGNNFNLSGQDLRFQVEGTDYVTSGASFTANSNSASNGPHIVINRSRGTTVGSNTIVQNGDRLGLFAFEGNDGGMFVSSSYIEAAVDGTPGTGSMPGRLVFSTTPSGSATPTERYRITNDGVLCHDQPAPASKSAAATLTIAELKTGIIQYTGAAATLTLPTGTLTEGGFSGIYTNMTFEWSVINTGSGICTIGAGTAHTIVGSGTVAIGASALFTSRRTAANTFVSYRLS